jgi:hypothetical protein
METGKLELLPRQEATNRAYLVTRVFRPKKEQMLDEIFKDGIFVRPACGQSKLGLPAEDLDHFLELEVIDDAPVNIGYDKESLYYLDAVIELDCLATVSLTYLRSLDHTTCL